jgi:ABC-2 type transport system permease protein
MNLRILFALVRKDFLLFFRNRFFALITVLALVAYSVIYYLLPSTVDEQLELGFYAESIPAQLQEELEAEGVELRTWDSVSALRSAVLEGEVQAGLALPDDLVAKILSGEKPEVELFLRSDLPEELREVYVILIEELGYLLGGQTLNLEVSEQILGIDRAGVQIPPRERLVPLIAIFVLMMETMGLATLIGSEIHQGTIQAILTTPLRIVGFFIAKGIIGFVLSFGQAAILLAAVGGLSQEPLLLLLALMFGAVMVTGIGFLIGSASRDLLSMLPWAILMMLILSIPAIDLLLPGLLTGWIKALPSYYLVDTLYRVNSQGAGLADIGANLGILAGSGVALLGFGVLVLRRKLR